MVIVIHVRELMERALDAILLIGVIRVIRVIRVIGVIRVRALDAILGQ